MGQEVEAISSFRASWDQNESEFALAHLIHHYVTIGRHDLGLSMVKEPRSWGSEVHQQLVRLYGAIGMLPEARESARLAGNVPNSATRYWLSFALLKCGHIEEGFRELAAARLQFPDDPYLVALESNSVTLTGSEADAMSFANSIDIGDLPLLVSSKIRVLIYHGKLAAADQALDAARGRLSNYQWLMHKGTLSIRQRRFSEAIAFFQEVLDCRPDDYDAIREQACAFYWLGDEENAMRMFKISLANSPNDQLALSALAKMQFRRLRLREAFHYTSRFLAQFKRNDASKPKSVERA
ncbi:MAG: tetratricopeptide repeat protein [Fimbriimonas sp.]